MILSHVNDVGRSFRHFVTDWKISAAAGWIAIEFSIFEIHGCQRMIITMVIAIVVRTYPVKYLNIY